MADKHDEPKVVELSPQERAGHWMGRVQKLLEEFRDRMRRDHVIIDEWQREDAAVTNLELGQVFGAPWCLTALVVSVPAAATLTLGERTIPIPAGLTSLHGLTVPMNTRDKVRVDYAAAAGPVYLHAMGRPQ